MVATATRNGKKTAPAGPPYAPRRLDIACGQNKSPGFKGIDIAGDADITHDLFEFPWPIKASSVSEVVCSHFVEHIPHYLPQFKGVDGWWLFFDEVHRIMKKGATAKFIHPYVMHARAFWDPTHVRYIHEMSWSYLNREWREQQNLDHYPVKANFELLNVDATGLSDEYMTRSPDQQMHQRTHLWNVVPDLVVTLKALK